MRNYKPNEKIIDRAVELWIAMLRNPKYDNLGENSHETASSQFANRMAGVMASILPSNNTEDVLTKFGAELKSILLNGEDHSPHGTYYPSCLSVDYHPDRYLGAAAEKAGLEMEFPWKTTMLISDTYVAASCGYAASYVYHYPLESGGWLQTKLHGEDIGKIIALVNQGVLTPELIANHALMMQGDED